MRRKLVLVCVTATLVGCNDAAKNSVANVAANAAAAEPKHSAYCFFKDEETKAWKASLDKSGNVTVTGKGHVKDSRYKPELGQPKVTGAAAEVWPTIIVNSGYASPDNWWDVSFTIPNSAAVESVVVRCGRKTVAELTVKRGS
jgi:hypothetical protein